MTKLEKIVILIVYLAFFAVSIELLNIIANILGTKFYVMLSLVVLASLNSYLDI